MAQKRETVATRVARLEQSHAEMAEKVNILLDAQIKTEARFQEVGKRFEEMGERIESLVSAIGALIGRMPPLPPAK
jgi:hypothetical protein